MRKRLGEYFGIAKPEGSDKTRQKSRRRLQRAWDSQRARALGPSHREEIDMMFRRVP